MFGIGTSESKAYDNRIAADGNARVGTGTGNLTVGGGKWGVILAAIVGAVLVALWWMKGGKRG